MNSKLNSVIVLTLLFSISFHALSQINGHMEMIENGHVILIDVSNRDTIATGKIENYRFELPFGEDIEGDQAPPVVIHFISFDGEISGSIPLALENGPLHVTLRKEGFPQYAGTPLQDRYSEFINDAQLYASQLHDPFTGKVNDSMQSELTRRWETFYLEMRNTAFKWFSSLLVQSALESKFLNAEHMVELMSLCLNVAHLDSHDSLVCKAMTKTDVDWVGKPAPDFEGLMAPNGTFRLSDIIGKKIVVLDFWATWCGPCLKEMPGLKEIYGKEDIEIIGISIDDHQDRWMKGVENQALPWVNIWDKGKVIMALYDVVPIPSKFVIDKQGIIVARDPVDIQAEIDKLK